MARSSGAEEVLVALGGNAILRHREKGTADEQFGHVRETCTHLVEIMSEGHTIAITHGNGPQVGDILLSGDIAKDTLPPMPLDVAGAESQGMIGYMFQRGLYAAMRAAAPAHNLVRPVATIVSQVLVDANDPAFGNPTKFIGPYYTAMQAAQLRDEKGWVIVADSHKGYRRVVPSPEPIDIIERDAITALFSDGVIVIACGGGGVPVVADQDGGIVGVEAVIDKDHTAALLAKVLEADVLLILTDVERVSIDYGKPRERALDDLTVGDAETLLDQGQFPAGSMGPKVESAVRFIRAGGKRAIITSLEKATMAIDGGAGTTIRP